jgi:uncharacterized protein (TIGR02145 family)
MAENLDVTHFRNGDSIPQVTDDAEWETIGSRGEPAWCYYLNDKSNGKMYGKLYNLNAVKDPRGLVPEGWSLPTEQQWKELTDFLGGESEAGNKLKSTRGWKDNGNGNNESSFSALPGGNRNADGSFWFEGEYGYWWTSTFLGGHSARTRFISYYGNSVERGGGFSISGLSVRCIKNTKIQ